ncbi:MAG: hypothetical protein R3F61_21770 [Myxococcota bacterium]
MRLTPVLLASLAACGTHVPDNPFDGAPFKDLEWSESYEASLERGLAEDKPVFVVLAAGPLSGFT